MSPRQRGDIDHNFNAKYILSYYYDLNHRNVMGLRKFRVFIEPKKQINRSCQYKIENHLAVSPQEPKKSFSTLCVTKS